MRDRSQWMWQARWRQVYFIVGSVAGAALLSWLVFGDVPLGLVLMAAAGSVLALVVAGSRKASRWPFVAPSAVVLVAALALTGCGGKTQPKSQREQIEAVLVGFSEDIADNDVQGACEKLSPAGRGLAIAKSTIPGVPPPPATTGQCQRDGLRALRGLADLPTVVNNGLLQISQVKISGRRATAIAAGGAIEQPQKLSRTDRRVEDRPVHPARTGIAHPR